MNENKLPITKELVFKIIENNIDLDKLIEARIREKITNPLKEGEKKPCELPDQQAGSELPKTSPSKQSTT